MKRDGYVKGLTGWLFTDARTIACPKCSVTASEYCRYPSGGRTKYPHRERTSALLALHGTAPFRYTPDKGGK